MYKNIINFNLGGIAYLLIEILWRGYSHWSMFILGGMCFLTVCAINKTIKGRIMLPVKITLGSLSITVLEFITGYILNIKLGMEIWDYHDMPYNVMGQICLPYMALWMIVTIMCIGANNFMNEKLFVNN